jgi:zinc/manganese transport system substrate-binding protein
MKALLRLTALFLFACTLPLRAEEPLRVSSFSTLLTEIASRIGGDQVQVHAHIKPGSDPHDFEPKPSDLKRVSEADIVLLSAKHMEGYIGKLQEASGGRAKFLEVGAQLPTLWLRAAGADGKPTKEEDPHWWHSVENTQRAAKVVRDALAVLRPQQREAFQKNATVYLAELGELQKWARQRVAELPRDKRKLVTSHDALQYFAKEYGFTVYPVEGLTPSEQPASKQVAELLTTIKSQRVKAVFAEDTVNPKVLKQITAETGAVLGGQLWVDGLGMGGASTYVGMFKHNVNTIVEALK